ncbi:hypothetical protein [Carnimonas bestiolae]|uniref:hypothetical protein n=1 Tax=Carnimonas bestiolae TaxID=3402172 RepID=UPI003EDBD974
MWSRVIDPRRWPTALQVGASLIIALLMSGVVVNLGTRFYGSHEAFDAAHHRAMPWLLVWRLLLYAALAWGWFTRFRPRLMKTLDERGEAGQNGQRQIRRVEWTLVVALVVIEGSNLLSWSQT